MKTISAEITHVIECRAVQVARVDGEQEKALAKMIDGNPEVLAELQTIFSEVEGIAKASFSVVA